ncbi:hypothetical protein BH10BAC2_BH10BAC2_35400 [soil metagenome]
MIEELDNMPVNTLGFRAIDDVTKEDFDNGVIPAVNRQVKEFGELNYLMIIDTCLKNWTAGAWVKDMFVGLKNLTKWHRAAILTDSELINHFTDIVSWLVPGKFKGFKIGRLEEAKS